MGVDRSLPEAPPRILFLLGLQRCGSTWVSNIFDSSPDSLCFMEPFSRDQGIFRALPDAPLFLEEGLPLLQERFADCFLPNLLNAKRIFSPRGLTSPAFFAMEKRLSLLLASLPWVRLQNRLQVARHINFNRFDPSAPLVRKKKRPLIALIKELRLYGKIPLLRQWFPTAKIICLLRHPCAQVESILRWLREGRLVELHRDLLVVTESLRAQRIGLGYEEILEKCRGENLAKRAALLWRVAYEAMERQLALDAEARIFLHEEFSIHPEETTQRAFAFAGIDFSQSTRRYLGKSSKADSRHGGVTNTRRNSRVHYREWRDRIDPALEADILSIVRDSPLMRHYAPAKDG